MKKTYKLIIIASALIALFACQKEYDYEKKPVIDTPASFEIVFENMEEEVAMMSPKTKSYAFWISAKSISDENLNITVAADPSKVAVYNAEHGTDYEAVPGEAFEFSSTKMLLPRYNKASTQCKLTLKASGMPEDGKAHVLPISIKKIEGTEKVSMSAADSTIYVLFRRKSLPASGYEYGSGTKEDPYLIRTELEMLCMSKGVKSGQMTYFRLENDVDMSECEDWAPVNAIDPYDFAIDFDGAGHNIIGFNCAADYGSSFIGVLVGSVHDVTFKNPKLTVNNSTAGLIAFQAGAPEFPAEVRNVKIENLELNVARTASGLGGVVGSAIGAKFTDIDISLSVIDAEADEKLPSDIGGIAGICLVKASAFENINVTGNLVGAKRVAGIAGYINSIDGVTLNNCHTDVDIYSYGENCGGLLGYANGQQLTVVDSGSKGDIAVGGNYCGGIIGSMAGGATIQRCYAEGNLTARTGNHIGGLIGNCSRLSGSAGNLIEDCYASGNVELTATNNRMAGGFIGVLENNAIGTVVRRCYASGDVFATYMQVGGMFALAKNGKPQTDDIEFVLEKCIAWNRIVSNESAANNNWSSGAIIGVSNIKNTLTDNYRRPDMIYKDGSRDYVLCDMENTSPSSPLLFDASINFYAYHGKAAAEGSTVSSVAKSLGWSEDVWDLSADYPKLRRTE